MSQETEIKKLVCVWCKGECGVLVHVRNGRLVSAGPDSEWPLRAALCKVYKVKNLC